MNIALIGGTVSLELSIRDDGRGFDPQSRRNRTGLGLISMAQRAQSIGGVFEIRSDPGRGTRIHVSIPLRVEELQIQMPSANLLIIAERSRLVGLRNRLLTCRARSKGRSPGARAVRALHQESGNLNRCHYPMSTLGRPPETAMSILTSKRGKPFESIAAMKRILAHPEAIRFLSSESELRPVV